MTKMEVHKNRFSSFRIRLLGILLLCLFLFYPQIKSLIKSIHPLICEPPSSLTNQAVLQGRIDSTFPSPRCCADHNCIKVDQHRYAILTTLRTPNYLPLIKNLACTLAISNPTFKLIVATVKGDLDKSTEMAVLEIPNVQLYYWEEFYVKNTLSPRFGLNWVKVRAWEMDEFDAILMVDSDISIVDDVSHLFSLPAHFVSTLDEDKNLPKYNSLGSLQGGVMMLRPCPAVSRHMQSLILSNPHLQFIEKHAEQNFFDWYFRYERWTMPVRYNSIAHLLNGTTHRGGLSPVIVHFTSNKPLPPNPSDPTHRKYASCYPSKTTHLKKQN